MQTPLKSFLAVLSITLVSFTCTKEDNENGSCNPPATPVVVTNGPVDLGERLELSISNIPSDAIAFTWTGPAAFESHDASPVIENMQSVNAGKYSVTLVVSGGCGTTGVSDSVIVVTPAPPCSLANNTATLSGNGTMNFYYTEGIVSGGSYFIDGNSTSGDLELEFAGTDKPVAGIYNIRPLGGDWLYGDVRVRFVASSSNWVSSQGKVYISIADNKVTASFCDVNFSSQTFPGLKAKGSAKITE